MIQGFIKLKIRENSANVWFNFLDVITLIQLLGP